VIKKDFAFYKMREDTATGRVFLPGKKKGG